MCIYIIAECPAKFLNLRSSIFTLFPDASYNLSKFIIMLGIKVTFFISPGQEFAEKSP
jgi:hypothetical protein